MKVLPFRKLSACQRVSVSAFLSAALLLGFVALGSAGCSANARKARYLSTARGYAASGAYDKAEIEYMNVLQLDPLNPDAIAGLGLIYFDQGRVTRVFAYLSKAQELQPNNLAVRDRLGSLYQGAGKFDDARKEALYVLDHDPADPEAPLLLADAATKPAEVQEARTRLEKLPAKAARGAPVITALGILDAKQRNIAGAQTAFERARRADPKFVPAYLGLASIYRAHQDPARAEQAFATAASLSPIRSGVRIQYAQFELLSGHADKAKQVLDEMIKQAPDCLPAYLTRADIAVNEQKLDHALALVEDVLKQDASHPEALAQLGRILLAKGDASKAVSALEHAVEVYPKSPLLTYLLGTAYASGGDLAKAAGTLNQTLQLAPTYAPATLALAEIETRQGNYNSAIARLKTLVRQHPELAAAQLALASVYTRQGDLGDALTVYQQLQKAAPRNPETATLVGTVLALQGNNAEARVAFEHALDLAPNFLPALQELANLDLKDKDFARAQARVRAFAAKYPQLSAPHVILAEISLAQNDNAAARTELEQAIKLQPDQALPYMLLARIDLAGTEPEKAVANLEQAYKAAPKDPAPLMMIAVIRDQQKNYPAARDYYEKVLALDPRFSAALNNLAYLYSEHLNDQDRAFELAQRARTLQPGEPRVADTLGWILYKRRQYDWALSLLNPSAEQLPTSPDVQYHLGMTYYMLGQEQPARAALQKALKLQGSFSGADVAVRSLAVLAFDPAAASAAAVSQLETQMAKTPDPVGLTRLAVVYERKGERDKATEAYERALKASPNDVFALLGLVRLDRAAGRLKTALELAKTARKGAPNNPDVTSLLGQVALDTGDYTWAASLLGQAATAKPSDVATNLAYGEAAYATGDVEDAKPALQTIAQTANATPAGTTASDFLQLITLAERPDPSRAGWIQSRRNDQHLSLVAGMALARMREQQHDIDAAKEEYLRLIQKDPVFTPAMNRLVILYAEDPTRVPTDIDTLLAKTRAGMATDPELARAGGILAYARKQYGDASALLSRYAKDHPADPTALFYLGMSDYRLKRNADSKRSLQKFVRLGSKPEQIAEAKQVLQKMD